MRTETNPGAPDPRNTPLTVGMVGLGLIGGSLARAASRAGFRLLGCDLNETVTLKARLLGIIEDTLTDDNLAECDVILLGIYPKGTVQWVRDHAPRIRRDAVVMDTCGVKGVVCAPCWACAAEYGFTFVGGHPMDGAAKIGFDHSTDKMFKKASMILCPPRDLEIEKMKRLKDVLDSAGFGRYVITTPEHHDRMIALTSQLPHVISSAFIKLPLAQEHKGYSAGSFRDMTRVAFLNEVMWTELFSENRENLLETLSACIRELQKYETALREEDDEGLQALLRDGRLKKESADREVRK